VSTRTSRNNLFLGTDRQNGIASLGGPTTYSTYDYDGFRPNKGVEQNYTWSGAKPPALADYAQAQPQRFRTLAELAATIGQETNGIEVDYDIFESLQPPSPPPNAGTYGKPYEAADLNFKLKADSKAVDAGMKIPNVNDGFAGRAPDLEPMKWASRCRCTGRADGRDEARSIGKRSRK
jgi:hypothetical protein